MHRLPHHLSHVLICVASTVTRHKRIVTSPFACASKSSASLPASWLFDFHLHHPPRLVPPSTSLHTHLHSSHPIRSTHLTTRTHRTMRTYTTLATAALLLQLAPSALVSASPVAIESPLDTTIRVPIVRRTNLTKDVDSFLRKVEKMKTRYGPPSVNPVRERASSASLQLTDEQGS